MEKTIPPCLTPLPASTNKSGKGKFPIEHNLPVCIPEDRQFNNK